MRIGIAGFSHEALNFSPLMPCLEDFRVWRGEEILSQRNLRDAVGRLGIEPALLLYAKTMAPSGWIGEDTYLPLREEIVSGFEEAGELDGICLVMHGAMLVENIWSGETDLVRSIRAVVGNEVPISVMLDLHGNLTNEFASKVDTWAGYRTAPHRDAEETLERALTLLVRCIRSELRPRPAFIRVPLLLQGEKATTRIDPMKTLIAMAKEIEKQPGILNAEVLVGFGWADSPHAGANVVVVAEDERYLAQARIEAKRLAQVMWDRREAFTFDQEVGPSVDEAIERALEAPESTVFVTDSGDNPTAGAPGDTPYFLSRLLEKDVPDAVFASMPDAEAARICFEAGEGARVSLSLGGKMDVAHGDPVELTGIVEHLYRPGEDDSESPGALYPSSGASMATVQVEGVHIIVTDIRKAFTRLDYFRKAGIEPLEHKLVVVKLGYLHPELRDVAPREILALSPGYADMDLTRLPYKYVTRPIFPLDEDFEWEPVITNVGGSTVQ